VSSDAAESARPTMHALGRWHRGDDQMGC